MSFDLHFSNLFSEQLMISFEYYNYYILMTRPFSHNMIHVYDFKQLENNKVMLNIFLLRHLSVKWIHFQLGCDPLGLNLGHNIGSIFSWGINIDKNHNSCKVLSQCDSAEWCGPWPLFTVSTERLLICNWYLVLTNIQFIMQHIHQIWFYLREHNTKI